MDHTPHIRLNTDAHGITWAQLHGRWGAAEVAAAHLSSSLQDQLVPQAHSAELGWDLRPAQWLDHVGAQLLWRHWGRRLPPRLLATPTQHALLQTVAALQCPCANSAPTVTLSDPTPRTGHSAFFGQVERLGSWVLHAVAHARDFVQMLGQLLLDIVGVIKNPRSGPWRDFSGHLYALGTTALPITALVGFLIGLVLAYLMALQLRQFGAQAFIVNILGISIIRELGPLLAAILVAGRSGSAITAQIGVMRVTQELDAMQVMGLSHSQRLVLPRTLALALAMPLLALWTTVAALAGGMLAADVTMDISAAWFIQSLPAAVHVGNLWLALAKSVAFGGVIALIGCHWGLKVEPNTQSLGEGTTAAVVSAITMVIVLDAIFAIAFKGVGF